MIAGALLICLVVGVTDGDTLKVRCGEPGAYEQVKVRISAIDAPESRQAYGQRAKQALSDLCMGQQASIKPLAIDRYERTLADVQCQGEDAGGTLVRSGMAWVYDQYAKGHRHLYRLQDLARAEQLGVWADAEPVAPWLWRAERKAAK